MAVHALRHGFGLLFAAATLAACSDGRERPAQVVGECLECGVTGSRGGVATGTSSDGGTPSNGGMSGGGASTGGDSSGGDTATGGSSGAGGAAAAGTVVGSVEEIRSTDLEMRAELSPGLIVDIEGVAESGVVSERYNGDEDFVLAGLEEDGGAYVHVQYVEGLPEVMGTLQQVDTTEGADVTLGVVQRVVMEQIVDAGGLSQTTQLDPDLGHAFVHVVDGAGDPLEGITVESHEAEAVGYDAGMTYSDLLPETQFRGVMLLVNMEAASFPGEMRAMTISDGNRTLDVEFPVVPDSVTLLDVVFDP